MNKTLKISTIITFIPYTLLPLLNANCVLDKSICSLDYNNKNFEAGTTELTPVPVELHETHR